MVTVFNLKVMEARTASLRLESVQWQAASFCPAGPAGDFCLYLQRQTRSL